MGDTKHHDGSRTPSAGERKRLPSAAFMGGAKEIVIEHGDTEYVLRITSQNKLILTK